MHQLKKFYMPTKWCFSILLYALLCDITLAAEPPADEEKRVALLIIDVQNCFVSGNLAVPKGNEVIPVINDIRKNYGKSYKQIFISQDWHCPNHVSFASQHPGHAENTNINLTYRADGDLCKQSTTGELTVPYAKDCSATEITQAVTQKLWPDHCVENTDDAKIDSKLIVEKSDIIIYKGQQCQVDSYSAFKDNIGVTKTNLADELQRLEIFDVHIVGLATDFCVYYTAKDANADLYTTVVIEDATRGISAESTRAAIEDMKAKGIKVINSSQLSTLIPRAPSSASAFYSSIFLSALSIILMTKFI